MFEQLPAYPGAEDFSTSVRTGGVKYENKGCLPASSPAFNLICLLHSRLPVFRCVDHLTVAHTGFHLGQDPLIRDRLWFRRNQDQGYFLWKESSIQNSILFVRPNPRLDDYEEGPLTCVYFTKAGTVCCLLVHNFHCIW